MSHMLYIYGNTQAYTDNKMAHHKSYKILYRNELASRTLMSHKCTKNI